MRETSGRSRRVSTKLKAALIALCAVFAFSAMSATAASASPITMNFNDAWIKVDSLYELTGPLHAIDPTDTASPERLVKVNGDLKADGSYTVKKEDFKFPDQVIDAAGIAQITLGIGAASDFGGTFNPATGAMTAQLPLSLRVTVVGALNADCSISPMNIALKTQGQLDFPDFDDSPVASQASAPFNGAGGAGAALGTWTDVGLDSVTGIPGEDETQAEADENCQNLIGTFIGTPEEGEPPASFDGAIWMGGTVTGSLPTVDEKCPAGQTGTPPNCLPETKPGATPFNLSKVIVTPKKAKVKAGKKLKLKVKVTNSGETAGTATVALKSSNKQVKVPKKLKVSIAAGKTVTKTITVKVNKKAKGKAKITAKANGKSAKTVVTVQKAKKKKK